jgi:hypothetical protein
MSTFTLGTEFTSAPRTPSYFNGRLLAADDLTADQQTLRARDRSIGEAAGSGVVRGFWVTASSTTVQVAPGLGITRNGEPVLLNVSAALPLAVPLAEVAPKNAAKFSCCESGPSQTTGSVVGSGVYLLTVRPATSTEGGNCAGSWTIAGLEFRVTTLPLGDSVGGFELTTGTRRNLVAHWSFGTETLAGLPRSPFDFGGAYGFDELTDLTPDDLALAVLAWDGQQISDLDNWSARRRVVTPEPATGTFAILSGDRRIAEGQARFQQFQDQAGELVAAETASTVRAPDVFGFLPPAGFLPIEVNALERVREWLAREQDLELLELAARAAAGSGFNVTQFFGRLAVFGGIIDWDLAEFALRDSWHRTPVSTALNLGDNNGDDASAPTPTFPDEVDPPGGIGGVNRLDDRPIESPVALLSGRPLTFYLVRENLVQFAERRPAKQRRRLRFTREGPTRSGLYVFFMANWLLLRQTRPPAVVVGGLIGRNVVPTDPGNVPR